MNVWIVILAAGLGSYLFRLSLVVVADRVTLPARLEQATEFVAPAAFTALAATTVASASLGVPAADAVPPLAAVAVAVIAVVRTKSPHAAVMAGMPTLWAATGLFTLVNG